MGRKRTLTEIKQLDYISIGELAVLCEEEFSSESIRQSTLKFYCEQNILPFVQKGEGLARRFNRDKSVNRIKEIRQLASKHFSIEDIVTYFHKPKESISKPKTK
jgi:DNA-binding transcriptional MerR regulator